MAVARPAARRDVGPGADEIGRLLEDSYYGLPRGRVTRPGGKSLILHGDDAPVADWLPEVVSAFGLGGHPVRVLSDEHERMLTDDTWRIEEALGITIGRHVPDGPRGRGDHLTSFGDPEEDDHETA